MGPWPSEEQRGGDHVDWAHVVKGEPLPELPADAYPDGSVQLPLFEDEAGDEA